MAVIEMEYGRCEAPVRKERDANVTESERLEMTFRSEIETALTSK